MKNKFLLCLVLLISTQVFAQNFAQWRGIHRDGKYSETGLLKTWPAEGPELLWHFDELGDGHGSAAITQDFIYSSGTLDEITYVFAFSHKGELAWKSEVGPEWVVSWEGVRTTPLIENGKVYLMTGYGLLVCMNAETGEHLWKVDMLNDYDGRNIQWGYCENLVIDEEKIFVTVGGIDANVIALNKNTGELIWKSKGMGEKSAYNSPAIIEYAGMKILVTMTASSILGINSENGTLLWSSSQTNKWSVHPNTPLLKDDMMYCVSGYGKGGVMLKIAEDGKSTTELWRNDSLDNQMGGVILVDDKLYGGGHASRRWYCLDWNTGDVLFSTKEIRGGNSIYADGLIYFYDEKRGFVGLVQPEGKNTKLISKFKVPYGKKQHWAHLVINNKKLFVRHGTSLMVYSVAK